MSRFVTGDIELDRALEAVADRIATKAVTAGIRAGLGEYRKQMRAAVSNPRVRKTIATRFKRRRKQGITEAKAGAGVGKHKTTKSGSRGRPGVGISKQNAHWYFLGTSQRQTKDGANRGRMPPHGGIRQGSIAARGTAMSVIRKKVRDVMFKEVKKLKGAR